MKFKATSSTFIIVGQIQMQLDNKEINLNPPYQRCLIWSKRFKRDLIISLFQGYPIGFIITRKKFSDLSFLEVVDGQQRIKTIYDFLTGRLELNSTHGEMAKNILNEKESNKNNKYTKLIKKYTDLNDRDKREFERISIITQEIITDDDKAIKDYFDKIQNQEELKAGELIAHMPNTSYDDLIDDAQKNIEDFQKHIGYKDNRKEIIKLLFSNFGFVNNLIELGSSDEGIIKFARQLDQEEYLKKNQLNRKEIKDYFIDSLSYIKRIDSKINVGKAKKRFIKMYLLFSHYWSLNSKINIEKICILNKLLTEYNTRSIERNRDNNFICKIKNELVINNEDEYLYFKDLFYLFVGSHKFTDNNKKIIQFWAKNTSD